MEHGLVSVVIPAYRADPYIEETLEAVLGQTYSSWEIIVVEDASEGDTERIVQRVAAKACGRRVVYLRHDRNRGQGAGRNTAIAASRGEYIALLDSDDVWLEGHLQSVVRALEENAAEIAFSTAVMFDSGTRIVQGIWGPTKDELAAFPEALMGRCFITPSATLIRKEVFDRIGLFDTSPDLTEDIEFFLRAVREEVRFAYVPGCGCLYRKNHQEAATSNMVKAQPRLAYTYEHYADLEQVSLEVRRRCIAQHFAMAGHFNAAVAWRTAQRCYLRAWRWYPRRIQYLVLALCGPALPILSRIHPKYRPFRAALRNSSTSETSTRPPSQPKS